MEHMFAYNPTMDYVTQLFPKPSLVGSRKAEMASLVFKPFSCGGN